MKKTGRITKIISNLFRVEVDDEAYECRARGKFKNDKLTPLVGDFVVIDTDTKYILEIKPRKNSMSRPMIANVDIAIITTSVKEPKLSLNLLDKQICCVEAANIEPIIILTKMDLLTKSETKEIEDIFKYYKSLGYQVFKNDEINKITKYLKDKVVVLTGQTGAGKSTLINKLDENLDLKTSPISKALGRGVHTTRHTELYKIKDFKVADTPGFSSLDLNFDKNKLKTLFREFQNKGCKFKDCEHDKEIGCKVKEEVEEGSIMESRYQNYLKFRSEMK